MRARIVVLSRERRIYARDLFSRCPGAFLICVSRGCPIYRLVFVLFVCMICASRHRLPVDAALLYLIIYDDVHVSRLFLRPRHGTAAALRHLSCSASICLLHVRVPSGVQSCVYDTCERGDWWIVPVLLYLSIQSPIRVSDEHTWTVCTLMNDHSRFYCSTDKAANLSSTIRLWLGTYSPKTPQIWFHLSIYVNSLRNINSFFSSLQDNGE